MMHWGWWLSLNGVGVRWNKEVLRVMQSLVMFRTILQMVLVRLATLSNEYA